jgi:hypothetical protein
LSTLVGLRVKMQLLKFTIKIFQSYTLITYGLHILNVLVSSKYFVAHFVNEVLFHNMAYIDHFLLMGDP